MNEISQASEGQKKTNITVLSSKRQPFQLQNKKKIPNILDLLEEEDDAEVEKSQEENPFQSSGFVHSSNKPKARDSGEKQPNMLNIFFKKERVENK